MLLKAESVGDKVEWMNKIRKVAYKGTAPKNLPGSDVGSLRQSHSDGSLVSIDLFIVICV